MKTCMFIGHCKLPKGKELEAVRLQTRKQIIKLIDDGCGEFVVNAAIRGYSYLAANEIIALKKERENIKLTAVMPFDKYKVIKNAEIILDAADEVIYVNQTPDYKFVFTESLNVLLGLADCAIVYVTWLDPGVMVFMEMAERKNIKQTFLDLFSLELNM